MTAFEIPYNAEAGAPGNTQGCTKLFKARNSMKACGRRDNGTQKNYHQIHAVGGGLWCVTGRRVRARITIDP